MNEVLDLFSQTIEKQNTIINKQEKIIRLLIEDLQTEGFLINMSEQEVIEYYEKRI